MIVLNNITFKTEVNAGADPGFFLGGGALVSCSTTPINHIGFFLQNTSCIRKSQVISGGGGAHSLHPPPRSAPEMEIKDWWCSVGGVELHANLDK